MLEGLKWAKIPISKSKKYVFCKVCAIAYSRGGRHFFWYTFDHLDMINVWIMPFHIMGTKWACIPACCLYPKSKVLYMKVIISYELKLSHKSSPCIACIAFLIGIASSIFDPILRFKQCICFQREISHWNHN